MGLLASSSTMVLEVIILDSSSMILMLISSTRSMAELPFIFISSTGGVFAVLQSPLPATALSANCLHRRIRGREVWLRRNGVTPDKRWGVRMMSDLMGDH